MPKRPYQFTPVLTFKAYVNGQNNEYFSGMTYTVRVGEPWDDLHAKAQKWLEQGRIRLLG